MLKEFCGFIDSATCTKLFFNFPNVLAVIPYFYGPAKHYSNSQRRAVKTCCAWLSRFLYQLHVVWHAYLSILQVTVTAPEPSSTSSSLVLLRTSPCSVTSQGQPEAWERALSLLLVTVPSDPALWVCPVSQPAFLDPLKHIATVSIISLCLTSCQRVCNIGWHLTTNVMLYYL